MLLILFLFFVISMFIFSIYFLFHSLVCASCVLWPFISEALWTVLTRMTGAIEIEFYWFICSGRHVCSTVEAFLIYVYIRSMQGAFCLGWEDSLLLMAFIPSSRVNLCLCKHHVQTPLPKNFVLNWDLIYMSSRLIQTIRELWYGWSVWEERTVLDHHAMSSKIFKDA